MADKNMPNTLKMIDEPEDEQTSYATDKTSVSPVSMVLGVICCPITVACSWFTTQESEDAVILHYGKYTDTYSTPGCHFANCFGREIYKVRYVT